VRHAAILICMAAAKEQSSKSNNFYDEILQKSLFTNRQISIIYKRAIKKSTRENISAGAYYRQLKQCRLKIKSVLYSILLLRLCGALDNQAINTLDKIALQLNVISHASDSSEVAYDAYDQRVQDVALVVQKLIDAMCKV
jgi:hypothetical protein